MTRKLTGTVTLSKHAINRWRLRVNPKARVPSIAGRLKNRIQAELKKGAEVNSRGALEVEVVPGVWAICYPSLMGGWEVATIINENWEGGEEDMKCHTCFRGAPVDSQKHEYYCTVKGGMKSIYESEEQYLDRSRIEARMDCEAYLCRAYFEEVKG